MLEQTGFLFALPRELRDLIYEFYLAVEGGYVFNPNTVRLVTANNNNALIDLALAYTCKLAAAEMHNLGLKVNAINFFTVFSDEKRSTIGRFQSIYKAYTDVEQGLLSLAGPWIDEEIFRQIEDSYPQFTGLLYVIKRGGICINSTTNTSWGEVPSLFRAFISKTLRLVSHNPGYCRAVSDSLFMSWVSPHLHEFLSFSHPAWVVPTEVILDDMRRTTRLNFMYPEYSMREKYRLSATSTALNYITSLSPEVFSSIRKIVLHENHTSICWPESHAQYMIPMCRRNPNLRIEQRVGLWMNVWPASSDRITTLLGNDYATLSSDGLHVLHSGNTTRPSLAPWIMETLALPSLGMPPDTFKLVFDGEVIDNITSRVLEDSELTSRVFAVTQRDAAWQGVFEEFGISQDVIAGSSTWQQMIGNQSYIMRGFPEAVRDITEGSSPLISCNFKVGSSWNTEELQSESFTWSLHQWEEQWLDNHTETFSTDPFLPEWLSIRLEDVVPGGDDLGDDEEALNLG
ncbi:hypothetical protein HRS9139_01183 [Pyrenophora teres f. teres]|nr:hypothetical protein HRS9139_01183 [Pyrenophora teres f. teres]